METDREILIKKAYGAIENYSMNLVVANELHSRYKVVYLVEREGEGPKVSEIHKPADAIIELPLVDAILEHKTLRHV